LLSLTAERAQPCGRVWLPPASSLIRRTLDLCRHEDCSPCDEGCRPLLADCPAGGLGVRARACSGAKPDRAVSWSVFLLSSFQAASPEPSRSFGVSARNSSGPGVGISRPGAGVGQGLWEKKCRRRYTAEFVG
jgi:hypothetical protein